MANSIISSTDELSNLNNVPQKHPGSDSKLLTVDDTNVLPYDETKDVPIHKDGKHQPIIDASQNCNVDIIDTSSIISKDTNDDVTDDVIHEECDVSLPTHKAPDGGWGWVIVVAAHVTFIVVGNQITSFGVVYMSLAEYFQADRGVVGWIGSLFSFSGNVLGLVIGAFIQRYGCRVMAIAGALIGAVGFGLSSLLVSVPYMYVTYGVIGGLGYPLTFTSSLVILQQWFNKRRSLALGIGTFGLSIGAFVAPIFTSWLQDALGLSGMYLIMAGIWLQNLVTACLYRPVRIDDKLNPTKPISKDLCDVSSLRNRNFVLFLVGTFLTNMGAISMVVHFMSRALFYGTARKTVIIMQSLMSVGTGVGRMGSGIIGNLRRVRRVILYGVLILIDAAVVLSFPVAKSVPVLTSYSMIHGLLVGGFNTLQQTVVVDVGGLGHVAKNTSILNMVFSTALLLGIPLTGFIYDVTGNYDYPFLVIGTIQLCGAVVLLTMAWLHKKQTTVT